MGELGFVVLLLGLAGLVWQRLKRIESSSQAKLDSLTREFASQPTPTLKAKEPEPLPVEPQKYEAFVSEQYRSEGYSIADEGLGDSGIDIIAKKGRQVVLIRCENGEVGSKLKPKDIKAFIGEAYLYIEAHPLYKNYDILLTVAMPKYLLDPSADAFVQRYQKQISCRVLRISKEAGI